MKVYIYDNKGIVYISVIFMSLIVFALSASLMSMLISNTMAINSNNDNYRAGYIIESVLELKIEEIMKLCEQSVSSYLNDLQAYEMDYAEAMGNNIFCIPPDFHNYITNLISDIEDLSESTDNPFNEYNKEHGYEIEIKYHSDGNYIEIISMGKYNQARKFINVELELPAITNDWNNEYDLPEIIISPAKVTRYYQTFGL